VLLNNILVISKHLLFFHTNVLNGIYITSRTTKRGSKGRKISGSRNGVIFYNKCPFVDGGEEKYKNKNVTWANHMIQYSDYLWTERP
jgi:hypothetical protein